MHITWNTPENKRTVANRFYLYNQKHAKQYECMVAARILLIRSIINYLEHAREYTHGVERRLSIYPETCKTIWVNGGDTRTINPNKN